MNKQFISIIEKIETALNKALPSEKDEDWKTASFGNLDNDLPYEHIQHLIEPNKNLIELGGKRWRPLLLILCYKMAAKDHKPALIEDQVYDLTPLIEFVHTASLIHDDIEDSADLRRGMPAAHITYGLDTALNAGAWLYFTAPVSIDRADIDDKIKLTLYKTYTKELRKLHLGQAMDIYWHRNPSIFPSKKEYLQMVKCKTGTLASLAAQIGCIAGGMSEKEAAEIGNTAANIGIGFQIIDDVINLTTGNVGKKRGDDIVEGKKSLPVLIHGEERPEDKVKIANCMKRAGKEGINSPAVEECISILAGSKCVEKAGSEGSALIGEGCRKLGNPLINELFTSMIPESFK